MEELQSIINKPKPFNPNKNCVAKEWHTWKQEFLNYLQLIETCSKLPEKQKILLLINLMGKEAIIAKEKMIFENPGEEEDIEILLKKFDEIFNPPLNEIKERFKFFSRFKNAKETIDDYVAIIQKQATKCNFGDQKDKFIIDMIIRSMDKHVQQHTFLLKDVSLSDVIKIYKDSIIDNNQIQEIDSETLSNSNENNFCSAKKTDALFGFNTLDKSAKKNFEKKDVTNKIENVKKLNNFDNTLNDFLMLPKPGPLYKSQYGSQINQNVAGTSFNKIENCDWCETKHMKGQCPHSEKCTFCEKFPHNICFQCKKNPHNDNCRFKMIITLPTKKSSNTINKDSTSFNKIENCDWCETKHIKGQCPHSERCTVCEKFPHNICFECKKNPHDNNCNLKMILALPMKSSSDSNQNRESKQIPVSYPNKQCPVFVKTDKMQTKHTCSKCGTNHPFKQCPAEKKADEIKGTCSKCGTNHPFKQCPAEKKADETTTPICWRCKTNHPYRQCPAYNNLCSHCNQMGHYQWSCKNWETYKHCSVCKHLNPPNQPENRCCKCRNYLSGASNKTSYLQPQSEQNTRVSKQSQQQPPQTTIGATNQRNQDSQYQNQQQQHQKPQPQQTIGAINQRNQDSQYQNQQQQHQKPQPQQTIGAINQRNQDSQYQNQHQQHQQPQPQQTLGATNQRNQESQYQNRQLQYQNQYQQHQQPQQRNQESQYQHQQQHQNRQSQYQSDQKRSKRKEEGSCCIS